jgi:hypothetical protein
MIKKMNIILSKIFREEFILVFDEWKCRPCECIDRGNKYHLIDKHMPQPGLMKMRRTFIDKSCLSSEVASIAFAYFLNSAHPSLKYAIQLLLIQTPQNPLQAFEKLVFVSQMNPFEFFFDCRKQVQITSSQIR